MRDSCFLLSVDLALEPLCGPELVEMVDVRRIRGFPCEQVIDPRHHALLVLVAAERQRTGLLRGRDRVGSEVIVGVGHAAQRGLSAVCFKSGEGDAVKMCVETRILRMPASC